MSSPERAPRRALAMNELDPYEGLQVDPTASHDVITAAYRALARLFHPDVMPGAAPPRRGGPRGGRGMRRGPGAAGPPPGRPSGSVLEFGRHTGWSVGEIARVDPGYLVWLQARPEGGPHAAPIAATPRRIRVRPSS